MRKVIQKISYVVLILFGLSLFGGIVQYVERGGLRLGELTKPFKSFYMFPRTIKTVLSSDELRNIPLTYCPADSVFVEINRIPKGIYGLNSYYQDNEWSVKLFDLKTDELKKKWELDESNFEQKTDRLYANAEVQSPILLKDQSIIFMQNETFNLFRVNKDSKVVWANHDKVFHHALNISADSNIWVCTADSVYEYIDESSEIVRYRDDFLSKIDIRTGKIIYEKSVAKILIENGMPSLVHGMSNGVKVRVADPIHLNDIEPVMKDGLYWKKGDVFLSLRNRSLIMLYRPSTNKIIEVLQGPFYNQHDIDILGNGQISLFNNNTSTLQFRPRNPLDDMQRGTKIQNQSQILMYDFAKKKYSERYSKTMTQAKVFTYTQGLTQQLSNGSVYVEAQNSGQMYILNQDSILLHKIQPTNVSGWIYRPHWMRIYEDISFINE